MSERTQARARTRAYGGARLAWGAWMLAAPRAVLRSAGVAADDTTVEVSTRVLGARDVAQGLASLAVPDAGILHLGRWVDLAHLATMLALAAGSPRLRRPALLSAASAAAWAGLQHRLVQMAAPDSR